MLPRIGEDPDQIYLFSSFNHGDSWSGPYQISSGKGIWYYPHLEVTPSNRLVCVYDSFGGTVHNVIFAASADSGVTWNRYTISSELTYNPSLLTVSDSLLFVFAQSGESDHKGLVMTFSNDGGKNLACLVLDRFYLRICRPVARSG